MISTAMLLALLVALAYLMSGCRAHFGPEPNASVSFAMHTYTHQETTTELLCTYDGEPATAQDVAVDYDSDGAAVTEDVELFVCTQTTWYTDTARPYGTSSGEHYIDSEQEAGSTSGDGMSDNLAATIGENVGGQAIKAVAGALNPASGLLDSLDGDTMDTVVDAVEEFTADDAPTE
jgi:hypothetical protein